MKTLQLLLLAICLPIIFHGQKSLTGLWTGSLSNDSNTIRKDQSYEIALTQYKQKVYGYTRSAFIVNDTLFYILKRVKGTIDGNVCEVKDDEIISTNFPGRIDKGVKVTTVFRMNQQDSTWHLDGEWKTNRTKNYYSITGKVALREETNLDNSKLFPHLEELKKSDDVPFYAATKKPAPPITETKQPEKKKEEPRKQETVTVKKEEKKQPVETAVTKTKTDPPAEKPATKNNESATNTQPATIAKQPVTTPPATIPVPTPATGTVSTEKKTEVTAAPKPETKAPVAAAFVAVRKTVPPQIVNFSSDSLQLALYDNGEVDGDTVSVLLNGDIILAKQGLRTSAIKKTIYVQKGTDEITLILYAENLGKYPPNTGLLVVHDGEDVYQVRFSADLQQNASVIFRRKQK